MPKQEQTFTGGHFYFLFSTANLSSQMSSLSTAGGGCCWQNDWLYVNWALHFPDLYPLHISYQTVSVSSIRLKLFLPFLTLPKKFTCTVMILLLLQTTGSSIMINIRFSTCSSIKHKYSESSVNLCDHIKGLDWLVYKFSQKCSQ